MLNKFRPHEYIERHAVLNVRVSGELPSAALAETLARMLSNASPSTASFFQAPGSTVLDVVPALPEAELPR